MEVTYSRIRTSECIDMRDTRDFTTILRYAQHMRFLLLKNGSKVNVYCEIKKSIHLFLIAI